LNLEEARRTTSVVLANVIPRPRDYKNE